MPVTRENGLTIVRHTGDPLVSVYRHHAHLGLVLPVLTGGGGYDALPGYDTLPGASIRDDRWFATEREAIDYLAAPGRGP